MKMKRSLHLTLTLALLAGVHPMHGLVNLRDSQINLTLDTSLFYDTEIKSRNEGLEDFVLTVKTALTYERKNNNFALNASVGVLALQYFDYSDFSDENFFFDLGITPGSRLETSRFSFSGDILLNSETRSDPVVGEIVTTRNYGISGEVLYNPSSHYNIGLDASYNKTDPDGGSFNELESKMVGLSVYLPFSERLQAEIGGSFTSTSSDDQITSENDVLTYFVGLDGILLPKLTGSIQAGLQDREVDEGDSGSSPFVAADLTWAASDRTSFTLSADRSVGTNINDSVSETLVVEVAATHQLSRELSVAASAGYLDSEIEQAELPNRDDEELFGTLSLQYKIVRWGTLAFETRYSDRSSSDMLFDYDRLQAGAIFSAEW